MTKRQREQQAGKAFLQQKKYVGVPKKENQGAATSALLHHKKTIYRNMQRETDDPADISAIWRHLSSVIRMAQASSGHSQISIYSCLLFPAQPL
jgi:hypothetical protein